MNVRKSCFSLVILSVSSLNICAQDTGVLDSTNHALTYNDSLSIFRLIDSLLSLEELSASSQLAVRLSYNSNVLWAGRTLGIDHFGLAPGLSYYHKNGMFADVSGFWSQDFTPSYYLTIFSAGYMHIFSKKFSVIGSYDHYLYNLEDNYIPYSNTLTLSPFLEFKPVTFRFDYSFYFGKQTAHRLMPSVGLRLQKKKFLKIDKVSFNPSIHMILGNATITEITFPSNRDQWIEAYIRMRQGLPWYTVKNKNVFGIMNYSFMVPLSIMHGNWSFTCSYSYNIPKALPGETLVLSNSGFISASVTRYFNLSSGKSPL